VNATNVWSDFYVKPVFYSPEPTDPGYPYPPLEANATAMFYVNSNGYLVVPQISGSVTSWTVLTSSVSGAPVSPITPGQWVRLSVNNKYGGNKWAIMRDDLLLREGLNFLSAATVYQKFQVYNGSYATTYVDSVYISTNVPASLVGDYNGDGMRDAWQVHNFGTSTSPNPSYAAGADPDGDGFTNQDESQQNSDPLSGADAPLSYVLPYTEHFDERTLGNVSGQHGWKADTANMLVTNSVVYWGTKALQLGYGELLLTNFTPSASYTSIWTDVTIKPGRMWWDTVTSSIKTDTTVAFYVNTNGYIMGLDGITWVPLTNYLGGPVTNPLSAIDTNHWVRFVVKSDYNTKSWSLFYVGDALNNTSALARLIGSGLDFTNQAAASWSGMSMTNFNSANYAGFLDEVYITTTCPTTVDSDGDGVPDCFEDEYALTGPTNDTQDTDGDGFTDRDEWAMNTAPTNASSYVHIVNTDLPGESSADVNINVDVGPERTITVLASDTPATTWTPVGTFTAGLYDEFADVLDAAAVDETDRRFYVVAVTYGGVTVTNFERYAMYRQSRAMTNEWYIVGVPVDYGPGSNRLDRTLGVHLARGLSGGSTATGDTAHVVYGDGSWSNYYLGADRVWRTDPGSAVASNVIPGAMAMLLRRRGIGVPARTNAVFTGLARSGPGVDASQFEVQRGWNFLNWPYDLTNTAWAFGPGLGSVTTNRDAIWTRNGSLYVSYELWNDGTWRNATGGVVTGVWNPGAGFYYRARGTNFVWAPPIP
jgi:hypothetical protein